MHHAVRIAPQNGYAERVAGTLLELLRPGNPQCLIRLVNQPALKELATLGFVDKMLATEKGFACRVRLGRLSKRA